MRLRSSMSLKSCRVTLEQDMGLNTGALKPFKDLLSRLIDSVSGCRIGAAGAGHVSMLSATCRLSCCTWQTKLSPP